MILRNKILALALPLSLIPFILSAFGVFYFILRNEQTRQQEEVEKRLAEAVVNLRKDLDSAVKDVTVLSRVPAIIDHLRELRSGERRNEENARTVLRLFFDENPYYLQLRLVDPLGREVLKLSKIPGEAGLRTITEEDFFRRTLITGHARSPIRESHRQRYSMVITQKVSGPEFLGMIALDLNAQMFERSLRPFQSSSGMATFLFDDRGVVFAESLPSSEYEGLFDRLDLPAEAEDLLSKPSLESIMKPVEIETGSFIFSVQPAEAFERTIYEPRAGENWFLGVLRPADRGQEGMGTFRLFFLGSLLLAIVIVFFSATWAARRITSPLERVSGATKLISRGQTEIDLAISTGDEVQELADAVKRMALDLREYQDRLVNSAKLSAIGEMASEISHEIQNRISGLSLWLQHLDAGLGPDDPKREYVAEMKAGLRGFMEMLSTLKQYYRASTLDCTRFDMNDLILRTVPIASERGAGRGVTISWDLDESLPRFYGDEKKVEGIILNLLLNAVESIEEAGTVSITTRFDADQSVMSITISDDGCGIPAEARAKVFYPFYSTKVGGGGLGLAIVSNYVSAHGGTIQLKSCVPGGTTIEVTLPLREQ